MIFPQKPDLQNPPDSRGSSVLQAISSWKIPVVSSCTGGARRGKTLQVEKLRLCIHICVFFLKKEQGIIGSWLGVLPEIPKTSGLL